MARLNISLDADHMRLLDTIRESDESYSDAIRKGLYALASERGFELTYRPAELTIRKVR